MRRSVPLNSFPRTWEPLLQRLVDVILTEDDESERLARFEDVGEGYDRPVVRGWGRDGSLCVVTEKGETAEGIAIDNSGNGPTITAQTGNDGLNTRATK